MAIDRMPTDSPDLWPRLAVCPPLPSAPPEADLAPLPGFDADAYAARADTFDAFLATLRPLVLAAATARSDRYPASLAHRSLPGCEAAWDKALAAYELFQAACEGRVR